MWEIRGNSVGNGSDRTLARRGAMAESRGFRSQVQRICARRTPSSAP
jgi:hypothetical protein